VKHARGSHESDRLSGYIAGKASSVFQAYSSDNHSANELQGNRIWNCWGTFIDLSS
jgi:hypothetical protein